MDRSEQSRCDTWDDDGGRGKVLSVKGLTRGRRERRLFVMGLLGSEVSVEQVRNFTASWGMPGGYAEARNIIFPKRPDRPDILLTKASFKRNQ